MATIASLAREFGMQEYELRAFADDLLDGLASADEVPAETEQMIREAIAQSESLPEVQARLDFELDAQS